ncbi:MAG: pyroglutamyl-peptidase I [Pseudomonadota bacterium]
MHRPVTIRRALALIALIALAHPACDGDGGRHEATPDVLSEDAAGDLVAVPEDTVEADAVTDGGVPGDTAGPELPPPPVVVLMSGFEAFGGYETNPSMDALWDLEGQIIAGLEVHVVELPVEWDVAWELLHDEIRTRHPRVVIATGMAGSHEMRYETNAVNEEWGEDNAGVDPKGGPVVQDGPETLAPTLPVELMAAAVEHAGLPTTISENAGTYLCNHVMYNLLYFAAIESPDDLLAGFIHVPPAPYEGSMTVGDITDAHIVGLDVIATWLEEGAPQYKPTPQTHTPPNYFLPGYE